MTEDPFYSARLRMERAREHLETLGSQISSFFSEKPYTHTVEADPNGTHEIHKIRVTKPFPFRWRILATEIIEHLGPLSTMLYGRPHTFPPVIRTWNLLLSPSPTAPPILRIEWGVFARMFHRKSRRFNSINNGALFAFLAARSVVVKSRTTTTAGNDWRRAEPKPPLAH
jgi:hypothetical protein